MWNWFWSFKKKGISYNLFVELFNEKEKGRDPKNYLNYTEEDYITKDLGEMGNVEISGYNPNVAGLQTITIDGQEKEVENHTTPGWTYQDYNSGTVELTSMVPAEDYPKYDLSFKVILIGNSGVGKSCLTTRATKSVFINSYTATVGFEFYNFNLKINTTVIKLQIWDTCGQEAYRSLVTNFYRNSSLAIVVYAVNE